MSDQGRANRSWENVNIRAPAFLNGFLQNEYDKNSILHDGIQKLVDLIYSYFGGSSLAEESSISKNQVKKIIANFPLSEVKILDIFKEEDVKGLREPTSDIFESYSDYQIYNAFWKDKDVSSLVQKLKKLNPKVKPAHLAHIKKMVDLIFVGDETKADREKIQVDIYSFFKPSCRQQVFIYNLMLSKYQKSERTIKISPFSFKLMLISLQFICLSFLEGKKNIELLLDIIKLSSIFYQSKENDKQEFLIENLNKLALWSEKHIWYSLYYHYCETYADFRRPDSGENLLKTFGKFFKTEKTKQNFDYEIKLGAFEDFSTLLFNLKFGFDFIAETLFSVAENSKLALKVPYKILKKNEDKFVVELQDKLDSISSLKKASSLSRVQTIDIKSESKLFEVLKKVIPYLKAQDSIELLLLNKKAHLELNRELSRVVLLREENLKPKVRESLWLDFIDEQFGSLELQEISIDLDDHDDDIILLDVKRTYPWDENFDKNILIKILRNIKEIFNEDICYYQGLNYFVAFMMLIVDDETLVFRLSCSLLQRDMQRYVGADLENLRKAYYTLGRLIQIQLPDIHEKFKADKINVEVFSSPWFLTIFGTVGQYQTKPEALADIWDVFVADSWPGFYSCLLKLIQHHKKRLMVSSYEESMMMFFDIMKSPIFKGTPIKKKGTSATSIRTIPIPPDINEEGTTNRETPSFDSPPQDQIQQDDLDEEKQTPDEINFKKEVPNYIVEQVTIDLLEKEYSQMVVQINNFWENYNNFK